MPLYFLFVSASQTSEMLQFLDLLIKIAAIIVPILVGWWVSIRISTLQSLLTEKTEGYKHNLNIKLEDHKQQIQSDFQAKFYEFQTRYTLYHHRKAEVIENLFESLAVLQNELQRLISWEGSDEKGDKNEFSDKVKIHIKSILNSYNQKRIFFDDDHANHITTILNEANKVIALQDNTSKDPDLSLDNFKSIITSLYMQINSTMDTLEKQFKELLSPDKTSSSS